MALRIPLWRRFPKIELHVHLEGYVGPRLRRQLGGVTARKETESGKPISGFSDFIQSYKSILDLLKGPDQYRFVAEEVVESLVQQNVLYVELFISAGQIIAAGKDLDAIITSVAGVLGEAQERYALQWSLVLDVTRHHEVENAWEVLDCALRHREHGVVALGLGGDERNGPARLFENVFITAGEAGLDATVHAGEVAGADSVRDAIECLGAKRIGHGLSAVDDPSVIRQLLQRNIAVEVCPKSNLVTGAVRSLANHPMKALHAAGVTLVIGSDDPGLFMTTISNEYARVAQACGLGISGMATILMNSVVASFLPEPDKQTLRWRIEAALNTFYREQLPAAEE